MCLSKHGAAIDNRSPVIGTNSACLTEVSGIVRHRHWVESGRQSGWFLQLSFLCLLTAFPGGAGPTVRSGAQALGLRLAVAGLSRSCFSQMEGGER